MTTIEWTNATWNPVTGCTEVSAGCDHCYAATLARGRLRNVYLKRPALSGGGDPADPFAVRLAPKRLEDPLKWREPRMIFVNSMSDLFHRAIPTEYVEDIFRVMLEADQHTYQILTKRPARAAQFLRRFAPVLRYNDLPPHTWIGTSVENQSVDYRIRHLLDVPASVRFLSCEPLLGPLDIGLVGGMPDGVECPHCGCRSVEDAEAAECGCDLWPCAPPDIQWVIVGGESGPDARPMDIEWARSIVRQCKAADVPVFVKQDSGPKPGMQGRLPHELWIKEFPDVT